MALMAARSYRDRYKLAPTSRIKTIYSKDRRNATGVISVTRIRAWTLRKRTGKRSKPELRNFIRANYGNGKCGKSKTFAVSVHGAAGAFAKACAARKNAETAIRRQALKKNVSWLNRRRLASF